MALTTTTLAAACGVNDTTIRVTSATGFVPQQLIRIDDEILAQTSAGSSGTRISVRRGLEGTIPAAHTSGAMVQSGTGADFAVPPPGAIVAPSETGLPRQAVVILTDAQIKALPTTAVTVLAAPGVNRTIYPRATLARLQMQTEYGNAPGTASLKLRLGSSVVAQASAGSPFWTDTYQPSIFDFTYGLVETALVVGGWSFYDEDVGNLPLVLSMSGGTGNFTGGHASNSLTVTVTYLVYDSVRKAFV